MTPEPRHTDPRFYERDYALDRLIMLSDGVFAIAMTLMALEVRPQGQWTHTLPGLIDAVAGPFIAFFWSFFGTAIFWATHRRLFGRFLKSDPLLTGLNLLLLGEVTLLPVATRVLGELSFGNGALWLYLSLYALIGATNMTLWLYGWRPGMITGPRPGAATLIAVAVSLLTLPVGMTALGVLSNLPARHWLLALMAPVFIASRALHRAAEWIDRKRAGAPLPAMTAADKVTTKPA